MASLTLYLVLCGLIAVSSAQSTTVNVSFTETSYNVSENASSISLQVNVVSSAGAPAMVTVTIIGFPGRDSMDFNISNSGIQSLPFDGVNDNVLGSDRTFEVTLDSSDPNVLIEPPSTATVNIMEDDVVTIGFTATEYTVFEGEDVTLCVNLTNGMLAADRTVIVTLTTDDDIGSGGPLVSMDFESVRVVLTFSNIETIRCVDVRTMFNANMTAMPFNVNLTTDETPNTVSLSPAVTMVTIQDVVTPSIMMQPMSIDTAFPNSNVTFTVIAMGGALSYQWSRNDIEINGATEATLTIVDVTAENEGIYSCFISNRAGNVTTVNVSLTVLRQPTITLTAPPAALLDQEITITCTAAVDATITLMVVNSAGTNVTSLTDVSTTGNSRSVNLTVMSLGQHTVTCEADNQGLIEMETAQFYGITIEVGDVVAGVTATAVFFCNVTGATDGVMYNWRQTQNGVLPSTTFPSVIYENRVSGRTTSMLTISNLRDLEENYDYTCYVSIANVEIANATGTLTSPGPRILVGPEDKVLQAGETLALNCTGMNNEDATQPLTIIWMFIAFDPQNTQDMYTVNDSAVTERMSDNLTVISFLTINNVPPTGGGVYGCVVFNRELVQRVVENATVNVLFTPQINFMASPNPVQTGRTTLLTCTVTAEPTANSSQIVRIMPNGEEMVVASQNNTGGERVFVVRDMLNARFLRDDGAVFQCQATNDNGPATADIRITVQARPGEINHTDVSAQLASLDVATITWTIPPSNNADITGYTLIVCTRILSNDTECSSGTLFNVSVPVMGGGDRPGSRRSFNLTGLTTGKEYEIVIRAENLVGMQMSPELGGGFKFNSAFPDDGQVVNVDFIPSETVIIVTWNLPALALATDNLAVSFNVMYYNVSLSTAVTLVTVDYDPLRLEQGFSTNMLVAESSLYVFVIRADYTNPNLVSSLATLNNARTLAADAPLLTGPQAVVNDTVDDNDELTVSWPTPTNTNFLVVYRVSYSTGPARRRRQTSSMEVSADMTMTTLPFTAFTNYTVNVDAIYEPPGGNRVAINLLPPTTFTTPERQSSPPRNVVATKLDVLKIRLAWEVPATPNGNITSYRVTLGSSDTNIGIGETLVNGITSHDTPNLFPDTVYTYTVKAINGFGDGMESQVGMIRVGFGVVQPVITGTSVGTSGSPRFTIDTRSFSSDYGRLGLYKVVVVRGSAVDPASISDASLEPAGESSFNYYVASVGDAFRQPRNTFIIGDGIRTDDAGKTFTNPPPDVGVNYFVFIRLYSSIDPTVFNNSELTGVLMIARPIDPAVIIAPIAVIAGILLIILVVLLVVVFLFTRPRRGYTIAATEDGVHRKKRGGALELRRTRLFSPVVNVPVPDVFTSAGQPTTLVCEASGTPAPEVAWTQNNEPLDKERFIQLADCSLFINDTDLKDEGAYIITATNSAGTAEQMVRVTVIRPSPPESDPDHPPIKVGEFTEKIALLRANDDEGLEDEYSEVEPDVTFTSYAAKININKNKNRYINIIPYDHSRVVLSLQDNTPGSDYINASYIDGFNRPNAYIATQGPQPSTFPDFWRMIWEFDCPTIVMVTNLKEEDKLKCHQYWPNYGTTTYGNIQVTLKGVENLAEYSIRTFHITPIAGQSRVQMPLREVKQFHFLVWPDHGVPQFATPLLSFRKRVAKYHPDKKGPMVVHCSAGVGRTGTFITIDTMLRQMEAEGVIDIFNFVRHMRFRRNYMVQTGPQYVFIHDALLEAIMCGDNSIPAPELRKRFEVLRDVDPESNKSRLQLQFENLNSNSPQDDDFDCTIASLPDNMAKNRFRVHLPANDFRVPLGAPPSRSEGGDDDDDEDEKEKEEPDYICASFTDGYRQRNAFIITQAPMSNTTGDFWRMIWEQKSAAIVMLTELEEDGKEMSVKYWPGEVGEASLFGSFQLELSEDEKDKGDYVTRKFKLSHVDAPQDCRIVTQFHFTKWPRNSTPSKPQSVIDLIDEIQRVQRKSGNQPITIHCDDGVSRTGAFCTLYSVLERVKVDQVVDVYLATKTLRIQRAGLLETLDQYTFVHRAVIEFLDSFSDYQNFK